MTTRADITQRSHQRAVRFFWGLLIGATLVSLTGNVVHAVLPYLPLVVVQIGAAAVPPIALLAAVHGIALAVRAGASGKVYYWAIGAVAVIGAGAFALSFLALSGLMLVIGYGPATAWIFPAIIDTAVAVSTLMLVSLGEKPVRRARTVTTPAGTHIRTPRSLGQVAAQSAKAHVKGPGTTIGRVPTSASAQPDPTQRVQDSAQTDATEVDAELASALVASGVTTQPVETVIAVLAESRDGASINAAAKASGINYRTAKRIVEAAAEHRQRQLAPVG
jgi:hypothetical protein